MGDKKQYIIRTFDDVKFKRYYDAFLKVTGEAPQVIDIYSPWKKKYSHTLKGYVTKEEELLIRNLVYELEKPTVLQNILM